MPTKSKQNEKVENKPTINTFPAAIRDLIDATAITKLVAEMAPDLPTDDHETIAKEAADFVYKGVFMGLCSSIEAGIRSGNAKLDEAQRQLKSALAADAGSNRSDRTQARVESRTRWAVQQMAQQDIRREIRAEFLSLYHEATGEEYVASGSNSLETVRRQQLDTSAQRTAANLLNRMSS